MSNFTGGDWFVFGKPLYTRWFVGSGIYDICEVKPAGDDEVELANARLIAAAPELLAALKELLPMWECGIKEAWVERARAAINKAEGRGE